MTAAEFRAALKLAGIKQKEFAAIMGKHLVTVNHWALGKAAVPEYASAYLELQFRCWQEVHLAPALQFCPRCGWGKDQTAAE